MRGEIDTTAGGSGLLIRLLEEVDAYSLNLLNVKRILCIFTTNPYRTKLFKECKFTFSLSLCKFLFGNVQIVDICSVMLSMMDFEDIS